MEPADAEFCRALAIICWTVENRDEDDAEAFRVKAFALITRGLDHVE